MDDLVRHIAKIDATLDRDDKVLFCSNYKVASISINQRVLGKDRGIRSKQNRWRYARKLLSYTLEDIEKLFKFTIVRNPYNRTVSAYHYLMDHRMIPGDMDFRNFVEELSKRDLMYPFYRNRIEAHCSKQYPRAYFNENQFVDFVAKLENIKEDWRVISPHIGVDKLPHVNKSKVKRDYRVYYNGITKDVVSRIYREDLERFEYDFE